MHSQGWVGAGATRGGGRGRGGPGGKGARPVGCAPQRCGRRALLAARCRDLAAAWVAGHQRVGESGRGTGWWSVECTGLGSDAMPGATADHRWIARAVALRRGGCAVVGGVRRPAGGAAAVGGRGKVRRRRRYSSPRSRWWMPLFTAPACAGVGGGHAVPPRAGSRAVVELTSVQIERCVLSGLWCRPRAVPGPAVQSLLPFGYAGDGGRAGRGRHLAARWAYPGIFLPAFYWLVAGSNSGGQAPPASGPGARGRWAG